MLFPGHGVGLGQGEMAPLPLVLDGDVIEQQPDQASLTERYVVEAVRFMRSARTEPFFLYLAHMYVHLPIYVQPRFAEQSENGLYGAAVESIDWATSVVLHELKSLGLEENTIVIFTSDNGSLGNNTVPVGGNGELLGGSNGALRGTKATTWEGGQRVPAIVRWPGRIAAGRVSNELTTSMDLYPTLAAVCGASLPDDRTIDGRDVQPIWFDASATTPHDAFYYYWMNDLEAIRVGPWKLHFSKRGVETLQLYNLEADIGETTDVAARHRRSSRRTQPESRMGSGCRLATLDFTAKETTSDRLVELKTQHHSRNTILSTLITWPNMPQRQRITNVNRDLPRPSCHHDEPGAA